jgi:hypothetical protein
MAKDGEGLSPLGHAATNNNEEAAEVISNQILAIARDNGLMHFSAPEKQRRQPHLLDAFDIHDMKGLTSLAPGAIATLAGIPPVRAYHFVQGDRVKTSFVGNQHLIAAADARSPEALWSGAPRGTMPASAWLVPIRDVLRPHGFLEACVDCCETLGESKVFEQSIPRYVVQHKWETFARNFYNIELTVYALLIFLNIILIETLRAYKLGDDTLVPFDPSVSAALVGALAFGFLLR